MAVANANLTTFLLIGILSLQQGSSFSHSRHSQPLCHLQCLPRQQHQQHYITTRISDGHSTSANSFSESDDSEYYDDIDISGSDVIIDQQYRRREFLSSAFTATSATAFATSAQLFPTPAADAAVGSLPEFSSTNAILQSITIDVTDKVQFDETIAFFTGGAFEGMKILREKNSIDAESGGIARDAWLGFGPETLSIPSTFTLPVSSFSQYGGHASIHVRYDPQLLSSSASSTATSTQSASASASSVPQYYKRSSGEFNNAIPLGDNIAYLQIGIPAYRVSQMVKNGGNILDAYGWVNVISPAGLPIRAIVGIRPDPIMFLAINCADVKKSEEFYYERLGFVRQVSFESAG